MGYSGDNDTPIDENSLSGLGDKWAVIWSWENGQWKVKKASGVTTLLIVPELTTLNKGKVYWIKMKEEANWQQ